MAGDPPATPPATSAANTGSNIGSRSGSRRSGGHVPVAGRSAAAGWQPPHLEAIAAACPAQHHPFQNDA